MMETTEATRANAATGAGDSKWFSVTLSVGCVVLAGLVSLLAIQNLRLKREVGELHARLSGARRTADAPRAGQPLKPMVLVSRDGSKRPLSFQPGQRTLVMIFSRHCPFCEQIKPAWRELVGDASPERVAPLAIFTEPVDSSDAWPPSEDVPWPVFGVEDVTQTDLVRLPLVPATIVLDDAGVIVGAWWGTLDAAGQAAVREALQIAP